jgi:hypothetical protein
VYSKQGFHLQLRVEKEKMMASKKGGLVAVTAANSTTADDWSQIHA